jgi:hypothetical protein
MPESLILAIVAIVYIDWPRSSGLPILSPLNIHTEEETMRRLRYIVTAIVIAIGVALSPAAFAFGGGAEGFPSGSHGFHDGGFHQRAEN